MSTIIPSEAAYFGPSGTQKALSDTRITAASYTARVVADGGRIVSAAAVTDAFNFCTANGISPKNLIYSASFGVREVNGVVDKIYSFNGNDLINYYASNPAFEPFRLDASGTFPVFKMQVTLNNKTAGLMRTLNAQHLMEPGHTSWIAAGSGADMVSGSGQGVAMISAYSPVSGNNAFIIEGYKAEPGFDKYRIQTPQGAYDPVPGGSGALNNWDAGTPCADWAGVAAYVNYGSRQVTTYNNGAIAYGPSNLDSNGFPWGAGFNPSTALMVFVMGGQVSLAGNPFRFNNQKIAEAWHVSGGTTAQALALSQRLDTLYS